VAVSHEEGRVVGDLELEVVAEPAAPLDRLRAGNARFLETIADSEDPEAAARALSVADPYAIVLGCSDSRVPPELVFDESAGRLFVIRVASNVAGNEEIGTIEYAVARWACPLVVVLGHTQCGGIAAAMEKLPPGAELPPDPTGSTHLGMLLGSIRANLGWTGHESTSDPWRIAVRTNVRRTIEQMLLWSLPIRRRVEAGQLEVVGAVYDVETGEVEFL
jgi:carbonic anhydrase